MLNKIVMPSGGQTTNESQITRWTKRAGERVQRGDILFEVETDKATLEVESYCDGILLQVCYEQGDHVETGTTVAFIGEEEDRESLPVDAPLQKSIAEQKTRKEEPAETHDEYISIAKPLPKQAQIDLPKSDKIVSAVKNSSIILASPAAKKAARDMNVDIDEIKKNLKVKVIKFNHVQEEAAKVKQMELDNEMITPTRMRAVIARRMTQSAAIPVFSAEISVDMTRCIAVRKYLNSYLSSKGMKISYNDIVMKCLAIAVMKNPSINLSWTDEGIK